MRFQITIIKQILLTLTIYTILQTSINADVINVTLPAQSATTITATTTTTVTATITNQPDFFSNATALNELVVLVITLITAITTIAGMCYCCKRKNKKLKEKVYKSNALPTYSAHNNNLI
ncbi:hypothetical protein F8M41_014238 [Gigaspora margarita]|uniref:Uncharacterized protein n=1 Tax=Gigaspora margarita TaxID=4874 RepID=A0A8H3WYW5_GIGMA|nr:hypothetical protein F8M41_014238 [Gigaspora margarita]